MYSIILIGSILLAVGTVGASQEFGMFTRDPTNYTVLEGENHTFSCEFKSIFPDLRFSYTWIVSTKEGANIVVNSEPARAEALGIAVSGNSLTIPANEVTNGTLVYCRVEGIFSSAANLTVLGPPTPPEPTLTAVNDTLRVSWAPSWSWSDHPVTHYTVTLTNTTDGRVQIEQTNDTAWNYTREEGAEQRCDVMVVNVTASSNIGEGVAGQAMGGFPIAPEPFELIECADCKVTFQQDSTPMYTVMFKLPEICTYQSGFYSVMLLGPSLRVSLKEREYVASDTVNPVSVLADSGMNINNTYTMAVFVSTSEGTTSANVTFDTEFEIPPHLLEERTIITVARDNIVMIAGFVIGAIVLITIVVVVSSVAFMYWRRRRTGVAELNLAKIFLEDGRRSHLGGPYAEPESRIYESIDGYQGEDMKKFGPGPDYPPRILPTIPPAREHVYTQEQRTKVPQIVFEAEKDNNAYLQLLSGNGKIDPEVRSTGSGEYTSMQSVSLRNAQGDTQLSAVNRLAVEPALQGFNEDNYMVFIEPEEK